MKRVLLILTIAVAAAGAGYALAQTTPTEDIRVGKTEHQAIHWNATSLTTSTTEWSPLLPRFYSDPGKMTVSNRGPVSISFSGDFTGAPVEIRATQSGIVMEPGVARFAPSSGTTSFSFDFVRTNGNGRASCRTYYIEWRSPTGQEATFKHGAVVVTYDHDNTLPGGYQFGCV